MIPCNEYAELTGTEIAARRRAELSWPERISQVVRRFYLDRKYRLAPAPRCSRRELANEMRMALGRANISEI